METKPLHHSQLIIARNEETGEITFEICVIPNKELYANILSYGSGVKVLSPHSVVSHIKRQLDEAASQYD